MDDRARLASLFFGGLLAGEEVAIRFGVRGPLGRLDAAAHIALRQGLIRTLRVLVPILFGAALLSGVAATAVDPDPFRAASVAALLGFIGVTLGATVPINQAALHWSPAAPPPEWRALVRRWETLDSVRTALAIVAFAAALVAAR